jgi:NTP pyrophosphatase (non-canonical NTP hydrolase)
MNFQQYVGTVRLRARPMPHEQQIKHALIGMTTEVGELGDAFKRNFVYGKAIDPVNVMEEVGDFLWYFVLLLDECSIHMGRLDRMWHKIVTEDQSLAPDEADIDCVFAINYLTANLGILDAAELPDALMTEEVQTGIEATLLVLYGLLKRHGGYSFAECLLRNDAKLEQRTGKKFDATAILNRDTAAERTILEGVRAAVDLADGAPKGNGEITH